jgi:hypothetical protein
MRRDDLYQTCERCDDYWPLAMRRTGALCLNCADESHPHTAHCLICWQLDVPYERHHVASERQNERFKIRLCLNCHALITYRQETSWDPSWKTEDHPVRCVVQGSFDLTCLWVERSPAVEMLRELVHFLVLAFCEVVASLGLKGWDFA